MPDPIEIASPGRGRPRPPARPSAASDPHRSHHLQGDHGVGPSGDRVRSPAAGCLDHRQDTGPDRLGQRRPGGHQRGQFGVIQGGALPLRYRRGRGLAQSFAGGSTFGIDGAVLKTAVGSHKTKARMVLDQLASLGTPMTCSDPPADRRSRPVWTYESRPWSRKGVRGEPAGRNQAAGPARLPPLGLPDGVEGFHGPGEPLPAASESTPAVGDLHSGEARHGSIRVEPAQ